MCILHYLCMHMKEKLFYSIQLALSSTNIMYPLKKMYKTSTKEESLIYVNDKKKHLEINVSRYLTIFWIKYTDPLFWLHWCILKQISPKRQKRRATFSAKIGIGKSNLALTLFRLTSYLLTTFYIFHPKFFFHATICVSHVGV